MSKWICIYCNAINPNESNDCHNCNMGFKNSVPKCGCEICIGGFQICKPLFDDKLTIDRSTLPEEYK